MPSFPGSAWERPSRGSASWSFPCHVKSVAFRSEIGHRLLPETARRSLADVRSQAEPGNEVPMRPSGNRLHYAPKNPRK